jgi:tRNA wybutosine-synthesizing protein 3
MKNPMALSNKNFIQFKQKTLEKLKTAILDNQVDESILPILRAINKCEEFVTTSSCAGRSILLQLPQVGDKQHATFLGKWHRPVTLLELKQDMKKYKTGQLWFITQSPIFHIAARNIEDADRLIKIGITSGFKHSGFKTGKNRILVEICSTERMDVPLGSNKEIFISDDYLNFLIELGNDLINRSNKKIMRLNKYLEKNNDL